MTKTKKEQKLNTIDLKIEKLKEQKKRLEEKMYLSIGKKVVKEWEVDDEDVALDLIGKLKSQVTEILNNEESPSNH